MAATRAVQLGHSAASRESAPPGTVQKPSTAGPAPRSCGFRGSVQPGEVGPRARWGGPGCRPGIGTGRGGLTERGSASPHCVLACVASWAAGTPGLLPVFQASPQHLSSRTAGTLDWGPTTGLRCARACAGARADVAGAREPAPRAAAPSRRFYGKAARVPAANTEIGDRGATGGTSG